MRTTRFTSIVGAGMAVLSALGATSSCALESSDDPAATPTSTTMGGTTTTSSAAGPTTGTTLTSSTSSSVSSSATGAGPVTTSVTATSSVTSTTTTGTTTGFGAGIGGTTTGAGGMGGTGSTSTVASVTTSTSVGGTTETATASTTGGSDECVVGQTVGDQVVMIGESFIAFTHQITQQVETRAQSAGSLPPGDNYIDNSVSGTTLANNQIPSQYTDAVQESGDIKYVLMDGGGNDCLINNNGAAALTAAESLFQTMAESGTEKVVYFFYPDPIGGNFANLKTCLDQLRPEMKAMCDGLTAPKCYWLDLRDVWNGHPEYTDDGIHPTTAGSVATGDAIWEVMQENCVAQ